MILCLNCASQMEEGLRFCTDCGFEAPPSPRSEGAAVPARQAADPPQPGYTNTHMYPPSFSQENGRDISTHPSASSRPPGFPDYGSEEPAGHASAAYGQLPQMGRAGHKRKPVLIAGGAAVLIAAISVLFSGSGQNELPSIQGIEVSKMTAQRGDVISLTGAATDPNNDSLTYSWVSSDGQILGDGPNVKLDTSAISSSASPIAVEVSLKVGDGRGGTASDRKVIMINPDIRATNANDSNVGIHTQPDAPFASLSILADKISVLRGENVKLTARVTGSDPAVLNFQWVTSDGVLQSGGRSALLRTSSIQLAGSSKQVLVTLTVTNQHGAAQSMNQTISVVEVAPSNWPPTISLRADRLSAHQGEDVAIYAEAADRDGDGLNYSWNSSAGQLIGSANRFTLKTASVNPGQVEVTATVTDARGQAAAGRLTIAIKPPANRPPYVAQVFADKTSFNPGENVSLRAQAGDQDGNELSYVWSTSVGTIRGSGAQAILDTSSLRAGPDGLQVTVGVTVTDSHGASASGSKYLTMAGESKRGEQGRKAGPISVAAFDQGEDLIITLSGTPGSAETSSGLIEVSASGAYELKRASGYIPAASQIYSFAYQENVKKISFAETPSPANQFSRIVVRVKPKNRNQPVRFTIAWRRL